MRRSSVSLSLLALSAASLASAQVLLASLSSLPGFSGYNGAVEMIYWWPVVGEWYMSYAILGTAAQASGGTLHVYSGSSCSALGTDWWSPDGVTVGVNPSGADPWMNASQATVSPSVSGSTSGELNHITVGWTLLSQMASHPVVYQESSGANAACGMLYIFSTPSPPPPPPPPFAPSNHALSSCSTACIKAIDASGGVSGNAISRTACIACGDSGTCPTLPSGCVNVGVLTGCYEKGQSVNGVVFCDDSLPSGAGAGVIALFCVVFLALVASGLVMMRRRRSFQSTGFGGGARGYAVIPVSLEGGVAMQPTVGGGFNQ